jgi:hypothetical protein
MYIINIQWQENIPNTKQTLKIIVN